MGGEELNLWEGKSEGSQGLYEILRKDHDTGNLHASFVWINE